MSLQFKEMLTYFEYSRCRETTGGAKISISPEPFGSQNLSLGFLLRN